MQKKDLVHFIQLAIGGDHFSRLEGILHEQDFQAPSFDASLLVQPSRRVQHSSAELLARFAPAAAGGDDGAHFEDGLGKTRTDSEHKGEKENKKKGRSGSSYSSNGPVHQGID